MLLRTDSCCHLTICHVTTGHVTPSIRWPRVTWPISTWMMKGVWSQHPRDGRWVQGWRGQGAWLHSSNRLTCRMWRRLVGVAWHDGCGLEIIISSIVKCIDNGYGKVGVSSLLRPHPQTSSMFEGLEFCVINGSVSLPKREIERKVAEVTRPHPLQYTRYLVL